MRSEQGESRLRVIVGLGNPGREYAATRHNLGFRVCDGLAQRLGAGSAREKFDSLICEASTGAGKMLLVKPVTMMNLSGQAVGAIVGFYRLDLQDVLVVCDDFNLELGQLRLRREGSHGGHNGLRDIIERLGTEVFPRLRLGTGPLAGRDAVSFCLGKFGPAEAPVAERLVEAGVAAAAAWMELGIEEAMNRHNARAVGET